MKAAILRATEPGTARALYVARVGHDGDYSLTRIKENARTFTPETAITARARLRTTLTFIVCPAAPYAADPYVSKYIAKAEAHA